MALTCLDTNRESALEDGIKYARMIRKTGRPFHAQFTIFFFKDLSWDQQEECFNAVLSGMVSRGKYSALAKEEPSVHVNSINLLSKLFSKKPAPELARELRAYRRIACQAGEDTGIDPHLLIDLFCIGWCF